MRESSDAIDLHRNGLCRNLNWRRGRRTVEDVIMVRSVEEIDGRSKAGQVLTRSFLWEAICVHLTSGTSVKVGNLKNHSRGLEQDVEQGDNSKMLNLLVDRFDGSTAVCLDSSRTFNESIISTSVVLQVCCCQQTKVVNNAVGDVGVVPLFQ